MQCITQEVMLHTSKTPPILNNVSNTISSLLYPNPNQTHSRKGVTSYPLNTIVHFVHMLNLQTITPTILNT